MYCTASHVLPIGGIFADMMKTTGLHMRGISDADLARQPFCSPPCAGSSSSVEDSHRSMGALALPRLPCSFLEGASSAMVVYVVSTMP